MNTISQSFDKNRKPHMTNTEYSSRFSDQFSDNSLNSEEMNEVSKQTEKMKEMSFVNDSQINNENNENEEMNEMSFSNKSEGSSKQTEKMNDSQAKKEQLAEIEKKINEISENIQKLKTNQTCENFILYNSDYEIIDILVDINDVLNIFDDLKNYHIKQQISKLKNQNIIEKSNIYSITSFISIDKNIITSILKLIEDFVKFIDEVFVETCMKTTYKKASEIESIKQKVKTFLQILEEQIQYCLFVDQYFRLYVTNLEMNTKDSMTNKWVNITAKMNELLLSFDSSNKKTSSCIIS